MGYIKLGSTGLDVSPIARLHDLRGAWSRASHVVPGGSRSRPLIRQAVEAGINFFDTSKDSF